MVSEHRLYAYRSVVKISEFYVLVWINYDFYKLYNGLIMTDEKSFLRKILNVDMGSTSVVDLLGIFLIILWCVDYLLWIFEVVAIKFVIK